MTDPALIEAAAQINPDLYVSEDRQQELIGLASEAPATTVRQAIREAVLAAEAAALERAAQLIEADAEDYMMRNEVAAAIRALKGQPYDVKKAIPAIDPLTGAEQ